MKLINDTNLNLENVKEFTFDLIYADMIYENEDMTWIPLWWAKLKPGGVFIVQTDWHTNYLVRLAFEKLAFENTIRQGEDARFVNHLVQKSEWGNHPKDRFHQCYDDIIIYSKGKHKFYPERIQVDKVTKNKGLNPSGRGTKTATAWIDDICLTTTSKERIKKSDGHLVRWQKPLELMSRLFLPFTDEWDTIADIYAGSMTAGVWCMQNNREYVGIELDKEVFELGRIRIENVNFGLDKNTAY